MALESSRGELQDWFRARLDRRSGREVMMAQSPESLNQNSFGTPLWESWNKQPLGCGRDEATQRILYGEGGGFPQVRAVVSQVNPRSPVACPNTKKVQNEF
jgi:hypothetical protein